MKVEGQCHCGAIAYEADVDPAKVVMCHCTDCQQMSGSVFRVNLPVSAEHFRLTKGEPRRYVKTTAASGAKRVQAFCDQCGSPIYSSALEDQPKVFTLRIGTIKQRDQLHGPAKQIWNRSRMHWVPPMEDIPAAQGQS
jgi:hypothetical protein